MSGLFAVIRWTDFGAFDRGSDQPDCRNEQDVETASWAISTPYERRVYEIEWGLVRLAFALIWSL
jgi:hypothetical protein